MDFDTMRRVLTSHPLLGKVYWQAPSDRVGGVPPFSKLIPEHHIGFEIQGPDGAGVRPTQFLQTGPAVALVPARA